MTFAAATTTTTPATVPDTFRAYVYENYGDALQEIKLCTNVPQTPLGANQVRIKVHAAALNPIDYKLVESGHLFLPTSPTKENPFRLGFDVAGTLVEVGTGVVDFKVGDAVLGKAYFGGNGSFAEYFVLDAKYVAPKPKTLSFNDAAGLPLAGKTSYQALVTYGKLKKGDRVLILGGSSGTGSLAIQIAKALGATHVITTTSTRNIDLVKSLGADQVVDYTKEKWGDVLEPHSIDLIYDCGVEPLSWNDVAQKVLKKDTGIFVTIDPYAKANETTIGATFHGIRGSPGIDNLKTLIELTEAGKLVVPVDSVHPFEDLLEAMKVQKSGRARGKLILQVIAESA